MKSKKAMELSINFIVMLIIAMALFSFGIWFAYKFFGGAEQMRTDLDSQTQTQIENLLMSGNDRVVIPFSSKTLDKSDSSVFGVGILNVLDAAHSFTITAKSKNCCQGNNLVELVYNDASFTLANNQNVVKAIAVKMVKNQKCICSVDVDVKYDNNQYSPTQKIYIKPIGATEACPDQTCQNTAN